MFLRPRIQERLDAYVKRLKERRYYEAEALLQFVPSDDGRTVDLDVGIRAGLPVTVRFEGDAVPADRLKELAPLEREGSIDEDLLEDSEARLENYLRQEGYWKADVNVRREPTERALTIVFNVNRGRQYRVAAATEINGMQAVPASDITALAPLKAGDLFKESALSAEVAAIQELYRQRGFAAVSVQVRHQRNRSAQGSARSIGGVGFRTRRDRDRRRAAVASWARSSSVAPRRFPSTSCGRSSSSPQVIPISNRASSRRATRWRSTTSIAGTHRPRST